MEQTNIANDINRPVETSPINPITPKPNNIYKYLFFVTLILLLGVFVYFYTNTNNNNPRPVDNIISKITPSVIPTEKIINEVTPTNIVKTKVTYKAVSVQDDKNSISKLVLIDQDNNETVIDESKYWQMAGQTLKPSYGDFIFSLDNNFLYYNSYSGYEEASSFLYDLTKKKVLKLNFFSETKGFTSDSKYFYACSEAGMNGGGAIVRDLISSKNIYNPDDEGDDSYNCQYDKSIGEVTFSQLYHSSEDTGKTPSQYKFSQRTGVLTKIK